MNDEMLDWLADEVNKKINLPWLNESQEKQLIKIILSLFLQKILSSIDKDID